MQYTCVIYVFIEPLKLVKIYSVHIFFYSKGKILATFMFRGMSTKILILSEEKTLIYTFLFCTVVTLSIVFVLFSLPRHKISNVIKGFAFIEFSSSEEAEKALEVTVNFVTANNKLKYMGQIFSMLDLIHHHYCSHTTFPLSPLLTSSCSFLL